ncbi:hypothetical protein ACF1BQ_031070 [Bradyrhizobium sp. RDT10]
MVAINRETVVYHHAELKALKSFTIELIMAYILDKEGKAGSIEQRFRRFLLYVAQSGLKDTISFPENVAGQSAPSPTRSSSSTR